MSFRHTYITEFLYKYGRKEELAKIQETLEEFGTVKWEGFSGDKQLGYFHGVIKDLDNHETKNQEQEIVKKLKGLDVDMKIVFE